MRVVGFVKRIVVVLRVLEQLSLEQKNPLADSVCENDTLSVFLILLKLI
jgi:hypothetical protein